METCFLMTLLKISKVLQAIRIASFKQFKGEGGSQIAHSYDLTETGSAEMLCSPHNRG